MDLKQVFERTSYQWMRYDEYEWKTAKDGELYLTPTATANPKPYAPLEHSQEMVLDALNVGKICVSKKPTQKAQNAIAQFVSRYGLLGFITALPTTPHFMEYEAVYLPKNHFIKEETLSTEDYLTLFFPFDELDVVKHGVESTWDVNNDREMIALAMTMSEKPMAVNMSFQREYAERYDWLRQQFVDWYFTFTGSFLYYLDYDRNSEDTRELYRQSMRAFGGIAPTYHIELLDKPTIVWDFHSLLLGIQMMFSFMLADEKKPLRMCKKCQKIFVASRLSAVFCSPQCKNQYNVYKSRAKKQ